MPGRFVAALAVVFAVALGAGSAAAAAAAAAPAAPPTLSDLDQRLRSVERTLENLGHQLDVLEKVADDALWFQRVGDVAEIDKVRLTGPPRWKEKSPTAIGAGNPVRFWAYVFIPRERPRSAPLLIFPHGGVHANFGTYYTHIVRELVGQGYVVVAPEYRGSTGYGRTLYEEIDYGGHEVEDAHACRQYALENYDFIDGRRVGILGWSHGGLITLLAIFAHPDDYRVAFAGVPVSDLISRLGYLGAGYADEFSAEYHIGQTIAENIAEYRRRSPVWQAHKLRTPLLIHTNTNDEDVNVLEVEHLINALKAAGREFEHEIYRDEPGGHSFDRLDTRRAKEIRLKIYRFLARRLDPPHPFGSVEDLHRAGYR